MAPSGEVPDGGIHRPGPGGSPSRTDRRPAANADVGKLALGCQPHLAEVHAQGRSETDIEVDARARRGLSPCHHPRDPCRSRAIGLLLTAQPSPPSRPLPAQPPTSLERQPPGSCRQPPTGRVDHALTQSSRHPSRCPWARGDLTGSAPRRRNPLRERGFRRARPAGFEPATGGLEVRCSIQLSYGRSRLGRYRTAGGRPRALRPPVGREPAGARGDCGLRPLPRPRAPRRRAPCGAGSREPHPGGPADDSGPRPSCEGRGPRDQPVPGSASPGTWWCRCCAPRGAS